MLGFNKKTDTASSKEDEKPIMWRTSQNDGNNEKESLEEIIERDRLTSDADPQDMIQFGMLPEFIGINICFGRCFWYKPFLLKDQTTSFCTVFTSFAQ